MKCCSTIFLICILSLSVRAWPCEPAFRDEFSGLAIKESALRESLTDFRLHSPFRDPIEEQNLSQEWNQKPSNVPIVFSRLLPEGVHFIDHKLARSESATSVKLKGIPGSPMVRASYEYQGQTRSTNVIFSSKAFLSNIYDSKRKKWLVSPSAQAVILFLHGMGMQTAGAHIANHIRNQFKSYKRVEVLSLDLPFHGEGPREFLGSLKKEVLALSAFAKKYIPPHVPLFVMAHSGGTVFAQKLMNMTGGLKGSAFFHPSLKGVILFSPIADPAPNKGPLEKHKAFSNGQKKGLSKEVQQENGNLLSSQLFESQNPVGELYGMWNITQWNARIPSHRGSRYVPALMAVGTNDPLVFTGFPKEVFHGYYNKLTNMETHYLEKLPTLKTRKVEQVGHWLGEYKDPESGEPIQLTLARAFMEKHLGEPLSKGKNLPPPPPPFVQAMAMFSHDLAFRTFLSQYQEGVSIIARLNPELGQIELKERKQLREKLSSIVFQISDPDLKHKKRITKQINDKVFKADSVKQALESIRHVELPEDVLNQISQVIKGSPYFDLKVISQGGMWLPSKKDLLNQEELFQKVQAQFLLKQEIKTLNNKKAKLIETQKQVQKDVEDAIFLIEQAIKLANKNPPSHLAESFKVLSLKRDEAEKARTKLISTFEHTAALLVQNSFAQHSSATNLSGRSHTAPRRQSRTPSHYIGQNPYDLLPSYQRDINRDRGAMKAYQSDRQHVQNQVIQAILQGAIGDIYQSQMYQKAGQDLYGPGFNIYGDKSPYGPLYMKLKTTNQELAEVESALHTKTFLFEQGIQEYQTILLGLSSLLKSYEGEGLASKAGDRGGTSEFSSSSIENVKHKIDQIDLITLATEAYKIYDVKEAFQAMDNGLSSIEATGEVAIPLMLKNHGYVFQRALDVYQKQIRSDLMPPLPGITNDKS